jgi:hypothetical protein
LPLLTPATQQPTFAFVQGDRSPKTDNSLTQHGATRASRYRAGFIARIEQLAEVYSFSLKQLTVPFFLTPDRDR